MAWIVKGFVAEQKGDIKINWTLAVVFTVVEKKRQDEVRLGSDFNVSTKSGASDKRRSGSLQHDGKSICSFKLSDFESRTMHLAIAVASEFHQSSKTKISNLQS